MYVVFTITTVASVNSEIQKRLEKIQKKKIFDVCRSSPIIKNIGKSILSQRRKISRKVWPSSWSSGKKLSQPYEPASKITDSALENLKPVIKSDQPYFAWIGYMEPHSIPDPPQEYINKFHDENFSRDDIYDLWKRWRRKRPRLWDESENVKKDQILDSSEIEAIEEYYQAQVRYLDDNLRRLISSLDRIGNLDETVILFTSDHGEEFFDHGDLGHRQKLYDELIHVPLIAFSTGDFLTNREFSGLISTLDIAPTVTDLINITPSVQWQGSSFADSLSGGGYNRDHVISELSHRGDEGYGGDIKPSQIVISIRSSNWKYILNRQKRAAELYEIKSDERESQNVIDEYPEVSAEMDQVIKNRLRSISPRAVENVNITDEIRRQMEELGYIGE
jgi:arylsulfatase A-like enzyme